jgi:hypothetical protein
LIHEKYVAVKKGDAGDDDNGDRETDSAAGEISLHFSILTQAFDLPRRR